MRIPKEDAAEVEVMKYCCQFSAVFSELSKVLFQSISAPSLLLSFIHENGLSYVEKLVLYLVKYIYRVQKAG